MLLYEQPPKTSLATARELHRSTVQPNGKVRVTCGSDGDKVLAIASKDGCAAWGGPAAVNVSAPSSVQFPLTQLAALIPAVSASALVNNLKLPFGIISLFIKGDPQDLDNYLEMIANEGVHS